MMMLSPILLPLPQHYNSTVSACFEELELVLTMAESLIWPFQKD